MGVPAFFSSLIRNSIVSILRSSTDVGTIDILYFDLNCLIHPQCFKVRDNNIELTDFDALEDKMIDQVIKYTNHVIRFVSPKKYVYLAVDGTAPLAKIAQQRKRRFEYSNDFKTKIMKKHNVPSNGWSNVVVTPGTEFMEKLHNRLIGYYQNKSHRSEYAEGNAGLEIIYDSYHTAGEGEHKILQDMKTRYADNEDAKLGCYGLDADLLFLAFASNIRNIYLIREDSNFNRGARKNGLAVFEELTYVDIDTTIDAIDKMIEKEVDIVLRKLYPDEDDEECSDSDEEYEKPKAPDIGNDSFIDDYILCCFFVGNDFLPHLPSIDIKRGGMDLIIKSYARAMVRNGGKRMVNRHENGTIDINSKMLVEFVGIIASEENDYFKYKLRECVAKEKRYKRCHDHEEWKREIWRIENLIDVKEPDQMKLGIGTEAEWNYNYYSFLGAEGKLQQELKDDMCRNYMEGISWVFQYYFLKCTDYQWQYKFSHGPLLKDLSDYLVRNNDFDINKIKFKSKKPIPIFVQLLAVLPTAFNRLLPESYRFLTSDFESPVIDMFPVKYKIDTTYQTQRFKCPRMIPHAQIGRLLDAVEDLPLTSNEKIRCKREKGYVKLI